MAAEPIDKIVLNGSTVTILLPIKNEELARCPICMDARYRGATKIENFNRHVKQHHDGTTVVYACWSCGFTAPVGKRYPRKIVSQHCVECVPQIQQVRTGRVDVARRNNIRQELFPAPAPAPMADGGAAGQRRQRQLRRHNAGHDPVPERDRVASRRRAVSIIESSSSVTEPLDRHLGEHEATASLTLPRTGPGTGAAAPPAREDGSSGSTPFSAPTAEDTAMQQDNNSAAARVVDRLASPRRAESDDAARAPSTPARPRRVGHGDAAHIAAEDMERGATERSCTAGQRALAAEINNIHDLEQLEVVMPRVVAFLGRFARVGVGGSPGRRTTAARTRAGPRDEGERIQAAKHIQRLYRNKRKTAVQRILAGDNNICNIDLRTVENHFHRLAAPRDGEDSWPPVLVQADPMPESDDRLCAPFTEGEITDCLKRRTDTSPGPDGIKYSDLRRADPESRVLTALFNAVWRIEAAPSTWGAANTILLHKKGDVDQINNWRPISLGNTVPKLFAAILSTRLKSWGTANGRFSSSQKGFLSFEGCFEHNFVLQEAIRDVRRRGGELVVAWLDLTSAFDSIPHSSIRRALEGHGLPLRVRHVIASLYSNMTTSVRVASGSTAPIHIESGVRQGCPLSPDIFNLTIEVLLRGLAGLNEGYVLEGRRYNSLFYADDGALLADSPEGMRRLLEAAESGARAVGIEFNPSKCATIHIVGGRGGGARPTVFNIQGTPMRALADEEAYEHLGIPTGYQVRQTPVGTVRDLLEDAKKIGDSLLAPWQKLDAVGTFLLPRLDFIMQGATMEKEYLTAVDKAVRRLAKEWLYLPQRASAELVYLPPSRGGGGLLPLADLHDVLTVAHSYRLLNARDHAVRSLTEALLKRTTSDRLGRSAGGDDIARYLSGDTGLPPSGAGTSFWARVRVASTNLKKKIGLRWQWHPDKETLGLKCGGDGEALLPEDSRRVANVLRRGVSAHYAGKLLAKRDQGKVFEVTKRSVASNHFLRTGRNIRFCDWRFIHRARLNVLPLNAAVRGIPGLDKSCRRCGDDLESLPHVLNHCGPHAAARQMRHNGVQNRLVRAARCVGNITINRSVTGAHGAAAVMRPDIVVRDETTRRINIVDVCVPFENRTEAFRAARREKLAKYAPLAEQLVEQGYTTRIETFMVGALGGWDAHNETVIKLLGISKRYAGMMRRLMISEVVRWSRDIYVEHVSGVRQYRVDQ
ncbi:unnamed protein product [Arctia plantaginis]|uniref:Reverse transcriptase domain-containing protein n=1 Tax=Arctia plantaginis TaxID=874455 RepID=A0A8S1BP72_ARCPL|nr:unnamed protein product [Arctia plantaginis]